MRCKLTALVTRYHHSEHRNFGLSGIQHLSTPPYTKKNIICISVFLYIYISIHIYLFSTVYVYKISLDLYINNVNGMIKSCKLYVLISSMFDKNDQQQHSADLICHGAMKLDD